jgi:short-chain Z-isoprenyl diphosphate synthase
MGFPIEFQDPGVPAAQLGKVALVVHVRPRSGGGDGCLGEASLAARPAAVVVCLAFQLPFKGSQVSVRMEWPGFLYGFYERKLLRSLEQDKIPRHIGVMVDGNRRWARQFNAPTSEGHQAGADKIHEFLGWCQELGVKVVTLYMLSTDNMNRSSEELELLMGIIANTLDRLDEDADISVHAMGAPELLPDYLAERLNKLTARTPIRERLHVNVAVGYGGRREIVDAVRELLHDAVAHGRDITELADELSVDDISRFLYTRGQPDPDLVIRTSGEQRLSGFLMWQSAYSEFYFCEALWPAFRKIDFLRALRDYAGRQRRFGS